MITIVGFRSCGFYQRAVAAANEAPIPWAVEPSAFTSRRGFQRWLSQQLTQQRLLQKAGHPPPPFRHRASPLVVLDRQTYIGGCNDLLAWLRENHPAEQQQPRQQSAGSSSTAGRGGGPVVPPSELGGQHGLSLAYDGSRDAGDDAFREALNPTQFMVLRRGATEDAFVGKALGGFEDV